MTHQIQDCPILGSDVATPLQQVIATFREIDTTFSALQRTAELFIWDGNEVPEDKTAWIAAYFDRLANSGSEYREVALQEIRAAGREARESLGVQELQDTFRDYNAARDVFNRLMSSTEALMERTSSSSPRELREAARQDIQNIREAVAAIDGDMALGRRTVSAAFTTLELLMGSEGALESAIHGLANDTVHADTSARIQAIWERFTDLEVIRTGTYNLARGLLDNAHVVWDLEVMTNAVRREILEMMQESHKMLCAQIVPTARLCQDIKEAQLSATHSPSVVTGQDGRVWSVYDLRLSLRSYRLIQMTTRRCTENVQSQSSKLVYLRFGGRL